MVRVLLPLTIFGGFNIAYLLTGFIYLSFAEVRERSSEDNASLLEHHDRIPSYWVSLLFFALFSDNLLRFWEGAYWSWTFSGQLEAVAIFGILAVINLFLFWSRIIRTLHESDKRATDHLTTCSSALAKTSRKGDEFFGHKVKRVTPG